MGVQEEWEEYERKREAFAASHKPATCTVCGNNIDPGDDVICYDSMPFCSTDCLMECIGAERFMFHEYDDEYKSFFETKETENDDSERGKTCLTN